MTTITLNKDGTGERTVDSSEVSIPDLWHLAQRLREAGNTRDSEMVIECWSLTHSLLQHIQGA